MGSDAVVVWSPATVAPGDRILAGYNDFSETPSIVEINASNDYNQVIALINRRSYQLNIGDPLDYVVPGARIPAAALNAYGGRINALRDFLGRAPFDFGSDAAAGDRVRAQHLLDLREGLDFPGGKAIAFTSTTNWQLLDPAYPSRTFSPSFTSSPTFRYGKTCSAVAMVRKRFLRSYAIPADFTESATARFVTGFKQWSYDDEEPYASLYLSGTDDSAYSDVAAGDNLDTLIDEAFYLLDNLLTIRDSYTYLISYAQLAAHAGENMSLILGENYEMTDSGAGFVSGKINGFRVVDPVLVLDYF